METNNKPNELAVASLIASCVSMMSCCVWQIQILLGAVAIVLGILAVRNENKKCRDLGIAGIVVGAVAMAIGVAIAVMSLLMITSAGNALTPGTTTPDTFEKGKETADSVMLSLRTVWCFLR